MVNNCLPYSGIGIYTARLYDSLKKLDNEIEVASWESKLLDKAYRRFRNHPWAGYFYEVPRVISQVGFIRGIPKDYSLYHVATAGFGLAFGRLRPFVVTVHDLIQFSSPRWSGDILHRRLMAGLSKANRVICVSQYARNELMRFFKLAPHVVKVVPNGIDHQQFQPRDKLEARKLLGLDARKAIVLHVGSEELRKNVSTLILAFAEFQKQVPDSLLIRIGEKTAASQKLIDSLGIDNSVKYFSGVKDTRSFYNAADLFVFPSSLEGFGFPPLEAMASGCPVLVSNKTSLPEVVGDAAIMLDDLNAGGFAHWMKQIYHDEGLKIALLEKGFKQSKNFDWDKCARETLAVYREALEIKGD
jgi:glycosyltransferase involved in cell wall biosynthesis